jgi:ferritin-like metal-binding protein YciE
MLGRRTFLVTWSAWRKVDLSARLFGLSTAAMSLQNLSDLFLYELWTLCAGIKQVIAELLRMSRLASNYRIRDELKAGAENSKEHWYLLRTIISSYQPILEADSCAAMNGLIASSEHLFDTCLAANSGALDAALICASLDIVDRQLARLERLRLYATLLSDWQTITILDVVLNDMMEVKHRLTELMGRYVHLDTDWEPESNPVPGDTFVDSESAAGPAVRH